MQFVEIKFCDIMYLLHLLGILFAVVSFNHTPDKHKYSLAISKFVPWHESRFVKIVEIVRNVFLRRPVYLQVTKQ